LIDYSFIQEEKVAIEGEATGPDCETHEIEHYNSNGL
jgi:hypothetical protein